MFCLRYFVLELCAGSLDDYGTWKYSRPIPGHLDGLVHMAEGLCYIHSKNLVHRDIKPDNILISASATDVLLKISDFGLCKETSFQGSYSQSGINGTLHYMPPETLELMGRPDEFQRTRGKNSSDVFAMGCVFYYFVTRGQHPFGRDYHIPNNVKRNDSVFHGKYCP